MEINRKLNLVVPIERDEGTIYVHSTPISRLVFESHFMELSKTYSAIYSEGLGFASGPRVTAMMLRKISEELNTWDGEKGVKNTLMQEIHRLSNVIYRGKEGWETMTFYDAIRSELFDQDELSEVENNICFFIVVSAIMKKSLQRASFARMNGVWKTQSVLLDATAFADSLQTSTTEGSIGKKAIQSLVPSQSGFLTKDFNLSFTTTGQSSILLKSLETDT